MTDANRPGQGERHTTARLPSFLRRFAAFTIDMLLLSIIDEGLSAVFSDPLSYFGDYRRLVTWACVIVYFGCLDSHWGCGRSIGKRLLGISVIRPDTTFLSPIEAGLRAALATAPLMLNGMRYRVPSPLIAGGFVGGLLGVAIVGLPLSVIYLVAISNSKRQSLLHDLAFGTLVVRQEDLHLRRSLPVPAPLSKGHLVVVSLILLASFLLTVVLTVFAILDRPQDGG